MPIVLVLLGIGAGLLTTVGGVGGGVMLVLVLSLLIGTNDALVVSAVALLVGNVHRVALFRRSIDRRVAVAFVAGAGPGSLLGGLSVVLLPPVFVRGAMALLTLVAVARFLSKTRFRAPLFALPPLGFGVGLATATAGGGGLLAGPVLLSAGLSGPTYLATASAAAAVIHVSRVVGYAATGLVSGPLVAEGALLAAAILGGNTLGKRVRERLGERQSGRLELSTLVLCVGLSLAGVSQSIH